jgi:thioredoxin reductase (NADPH)
MTDHLHDLIIIGGGPAGLAAGIYAARDGFDCILLESRTPGGQLANTAGIANYPGFPGEVSGFELAEKMREQAVAFGLKIEEEEARGLARDGARLRVECAGGAREARAVIVATGATRRKLGVPGEDRLGGRGVSYCGTCDGPLFRDMRVVVAGGGDTAVEEAVFIARFASRVTIVHRRDRLRASPGLQRRAFAEKKIDFCWDSVIREIRGEGRVSGVMVGEAAGGGAREFPCEGVFIFAGSTPNTAFLKGALALDEAGCVVADISMATSLPGVFAAGDARRDSVRQIAAAVGDGVTAVIQAERYLGARG